MIWPRTGDTPAAEVIREEPWLYPLISGYFDVPGQHATRFLEVVRGFAAALAWAATVHPADYAEDTPGQDQLISDLRAEVGPLRRDDRDPHLALIGAAMARLMDQAPDTGPGAPVDPADGRSSLAQGIAAGEIIAPDPYRQGGTSQLPDLTGLPVESGGLVEERERQRAAIRDDS
jgi:hypothetical protein